jgi:hypothetical protein
MVLVRESFEKKSRRLPRFRVGFRPTYAPRRGQRMFLMTKAYFVFLSCPDPSGRPGAKAALKARETVFRRAPGQIVCGVSKGAAGNLAGKPKPVGLELSSAAAERGNCPKAKPDGEDLKGRRSLLGSITVKSLPGGAE